MSYTLPNFSYANRQSWSNRNLGEAISDSLPLRYFQPEYAVQMLSQVYKKPMTLATRSAVTRIEAISMLPVSR